MKLISWNVNGIRACVNKGFLDFFQTVDADVFCIQETKMHPGQLVLDLPGYHQYWHSAEKKGYSGTAVFSKQEPLNVTYDFDIPQHIGEGRVITCEYPRFFLVNVYVPNAQEELKRLDYRLQWETDFKNYLVNLKKIKPVVLCGDLNVAHQPIDLKNPSANRKNPGFSDAERQAFSELLAAGFVDTFRYFYPDLKDQYSWWSYRFQARTRNAGWRIDYFVVSEDMIVSVEDSIIYQSILGSDHCPVGIIIKEETK